MYTRILHATDLKENHYNLCQKAVEIAKAFGATLHLLHVIEPPASLQLAQGLGFAELAVPVKEDALIVLNVLGDSLGIPKSQQHVEIGSIKMHVLEKTRGLGCELLIVGSHDPNNHLPSFLGSTAHAVVHHAPCDVLTVRL
ncbi:MAG: universal stress protein UspA [Legionellales bacterium RIFCSPHIGHO2_12_FULL_42_9]|nr:MAG: universal stress protein UspA [Legionellales bacterium RIFCSPHIGHO2_12_FULL_42_9]